MKYHTVDFFFFHVFSPKISCLDYVACGELFDVSQSSTLSVV